MKTVLTNERERERAERERKRAEKEEAMEVDGVANGDAAKVEDEEEAPTCTLWYPPALTSVLSCDFHLDTSIEAPPSILPPKRYCDITGLEVSLTMHVLRQIC